MMLILVTYDVSTVDAAGRRRLRRVAQACKDYGTRVQKSVFECQVGQTEWTRLRTRLITEMDAEHDSLRFYFLDETAVQRIEHHGAAKPVDLNEPLML
jgi:CRISPR-associated protein Cas2